MDKQREILQALGWRVERRHYAVSDVTVFFLVTPENKFLDGAPSADKAWSKANLSDPGVFWPMFEEWIAANDMSFVHELCWGESPCKDPCHHFSIYKQGRHAEPYSQGTGPRGGVAEAGISAWHSALVAMGKIEARDVR